jgi:transposase
MRSVPEAARRAETGIGQMLKQCPGFRGYYILDAGGGVGASVTVFDTQGAALAANAKALVGHLLWAVVSWRGDPRAPRCPMSCHQKDPLRPLTADERQELIRLSRSLSAPAAQVERARALLAIADGATYTAAAHQVGRRHTETISAWVSRFNRDGLAAVRPGHGGGARIRYGADAQQRILTEWARTPQRDQDGTATWSLSLLQKALRKAPDGLPKVSTFTIWRTLHEAGLSWQKSRTWCQTGVAMRQRKHGVVRVSDPDAAAKKS